MEKISSIEEFEQALEKGEAFLFIKHSLTCPISHEAFNECKSFDEQSQVPVYYLAVQESRELSNYIADRFQIKHESPQALIFVDGKAVWDASHWKITKSSLGQAVEGTLS